MKPNLVNIKELELELSNLHPDMAGRLRTPDAIRTFITGGNAYLTIRSLKTQTRFTYRVTVPKDALEKKQDPLPYFISVLTGDDNTSDYRFFGTMWVDASTKHILKYKHSGKARITDKAPSVVAIRWMLSQIHRGGTALESPSNFLHQLEVWHDGRCGRCGRMLTVPESVSSGFGPECIQHVR